MQLIAILLLISSFIILGGALAFVVKWFRTCHTCRSVRILREGIRHIGITAIIEYPDSTQPFSALLDEEYPYSEIILITDLQRYHATFGELIQKYHLIRVNHSHIRHVRALYRSRHRAFRRVVMVNLPIEYSQKALAVAREVASYNYLLHLRGESIIARNAITYCANIIASHRISDDISMRSFIGKELYLTRCDTPPKRRKPQVISDRILAWSNKERHLSLGALSLPAIILIVAHFAESPILTIVAVVVLSTIVLLVYISCCTASEKSLFATLDAIILNFHSFLVNGAKRFYMRCRERVFSDLSKPYFNVRLTRLVSKTHDTPHGSFRVPTQNRPVRYRADSQREQ